MTTIDAKLAAPDRLARLFEAGVIAPGDPTELTGIIQGEPELAPQSFYLAVRAENVLVSGKQYRVTGLVLLLAHVRDETSTREYKALELRHGARIRVMTAVDRENDFQNPGVLPFTEYLERKGYEATGVIKSPLLVERLDDERVFLPMAWLYQWRAYLEKEFARNFSSDTAGVLDAALLGNRYNVSLATADRFRAGGTFHVLVIAGLRISFIGGITFIFVRWLTTRRLLQFLFSTSLLWAYAIAVGAHMPVVRATLVFTLVVFARVVWRRANSLNVIGGAAMALLVWRPNDLFDPSFQLTFLSVLAIVAFAVPLWQKMQRIGSWRPAMVTPFPPDCSPWLRTISEALFWSERAWLSEMKASNISYRLFKTDWAGRFERWHIQKFVRYVAVALLVSGSVQLGMLPLLILYFHRISFAGLILNIFVGALMAMLAFAALAAILFSHVSSLLSALLITLAEKLSWLMIHAVDPFAKFGIAAFRLPHYSGWLSAIYVGYFLSLVALAIALAQWNPLKIAASNIVARRRHLQLTWTIFAALLTLIIMHPFSAKSPDGRLHLEYLDVGQGDCALLTMPNGTTLLIDGGGRPNIDWENHDNTDIEEVFVRDTRTIGEGVVSEYLWSQGLDQVDYLLPTHADADHIDGLNDVARNFRVRGAIVARTPTDDREFAKFASTMNHAGIPIELIGSDDEIKIGDVAIKVLWPPADASVAAPWRNNDSVILSVRFGETSFLFTGDIEKEAESLVLKQRADLRSDVVKVAHHGSRTSSIPEFVAATKPSLAVISVGRTSIFGHPAKEVVERWRASGAQVMTTGQRGTISVTSDGHTLRVTTSVK